jgi:16S rRNA processing protein RimM
MKEYIKVGTITQPFGIKGEMKVYPHVDDPAHYKKLKQVFFEKGESYEEFEIESVRMALPLVIIKFRGIDTPEDIRAYRQKDIYVLRKDAPPLEEGEHYFADLLGLDVTDDTGVYRGKLTDIIQTGANDVYEITGDDGKSFLLPVIKQCILDVDIEAGTMKIHILEGLLDL